MIIRAILPVWAQQEFPQLPKIVEGVFSDEELLNLNEQYYNIHYLPNYPSKYDPSVNVDGSHIDTFEWVFVDMDLKEKVYATKEDFIETVLDQGIEPTRIIDSGNGIHVYWKVSDLDAMSYLKFQRRLMRFFKTDEAVAKIYQLMRPTGFVNTKHQGEFKMCVEVYSSDKTYTSEQLNKQLPIISKEDQEYCENHFNRTYDIKRNDIKVDDKIPLKFAELIRTNEEVRKISSGEVEDRSAGDYRLGHIMFAHGFTKDEALSVLVNTEKANSRAPIHRVGYAVNIIDKIWTFEIAEDKKKLSLSSSVKDILQKGPEALKGTRFACHSYLDATHHGFRLGQVIGLVAGSGVGKTAMALNMFEGFVKNNPDYDHFFIPLEQPTNEIAERWRNICGDRVHLHDKVHVISNYGEDGSFRHLSFDEIREYLMEFQKETGRKIGCVVIDHIGALKKKGKDGENQDIMDICHSMKAFAIQTNTLLIMQSQSSREKAGIGDLELSKDAAYGTVYFESYCDFLITIWQPLKRCYTESACPAVTAFKFCKIRHKKMGIDQIQEDVCYKLLFDPSTERFRELTQQEEKSFDFFNKQATNKRGQDRKTDLVTYVSINWTQGATDGEVSSNQNGRAASGT